MSAKSFLDLVFESGKELAEKVETFVEEKVEIPEDAAERAEMMANVGKGAAAAGALALLLGTDFGRKITGKAIKLGSVAAVAGLGYTVYQKYQKENGLDDGGLPLHRLDGPAAERRSIAILNSMIAAANADGHVDAEERKVIDTQLQKLKLEPDAAKIIRAEIENPHDTASLAEQADSQEAAVEMYLASRMMIDANNTDEKKYLEDLKGALQLPDALVAELDKHA